MCHQQSLAFTDGLAQAIGATGGQHPRSSMSLANVVYNASYGWSERTWSLESQMEVPMYNEHPVEMGLKGHEAEVLERFAADADYVERFRTAFPGDPNPITLPNIVKAIASFERIIVSADSAFDRYLYKDDHSGMSPAAKRGVALFFSDRLKCSECHGSVNISGPTIFSGAMPSDPEAFFHDTGVAAQSGEVPRAHAAQHRGNRAVHARRKHRHIEGRGGPLRGRRAKRASEERQGSRVCDLAVRDRRPGGVSAHPHGREVPDQPGLQQSPEQS